MSTALVKKWDIEGYSDLGITKCSIFFFIMSRSLSMNTELTDIDENAFEGVNLLNEL